MKIYEIITDRIIAALDQGTVPWRKPWSSGGLPKNLISRKPYHGVNVLLLGMQGYASPYWLTFKQAADMGAMVRKGEKGTPVVFWNWTTKQVQNKSGDLEEKDIPFFRYYTVFNLAQIEWLTLPEYVAAESFEPIIACEEVIDRMPNPPTIEHGFAEACYNRLNDVIKMPPRLSFKSEANYYGTLYHEAVHSTGHSSRLNRKGIEEKHSFGSPEYSKEELIAEFGASFLCGYTGIDNDTIENQAAYIEHWRKELSADKKLVISAAAQAQKAVDFILDLRAESEKAA